MSFFDSKEEVINIELTQYGKKLLSQGRFKPTYYSFHDDDVLYDSSYGEFVDEKQNNIEDRIFNETPLTKPVYVYSGLDQNLKINEQNIKTRKAVLNPLGRSSYNSSYYPAFQVFSEMGEMDPGLFQPEEPEFKTSNTERRSTLVQVPQIYMKKIIYQILLKDGCLPIFSFGNNKNLYAKNIYHFFKILEKNVDDDKENFDLEVYIEEEEIIDNTTRTFWKKLFFKEKINNNLTYKIENNILYDSKEIPAESLAAIKNPEDYVENYVQIFFDFAAEKRAVVIDKQCPDINNVDIDGNPVLPREPDAPPEDPIEHCP